MSAAMRWTFIHTPLIRVARGHVHSPRTHDVSRAAHPSDAALLRSYGSRLVVHPEPNAIPERLTPVAGGGNRGIKERTNVRRLLYTIFPKPKSEVSHPHRWSF